jgi:NTE family protein
VTALVLSAGGLFAAWQVGVWKALSRCFHPDLVVGASAGALNGWAIAGGCSSEELAEAWLEPNTARILRIRQPQALFDMSRWLFDRFQPRLPVGVPLVELPLLRACLVRDREVRWEHLAASCAIPLWFPHVRIDGHRYVDGGLRAALPLWAAEKMGATRAIAVNAFDVPLAALLRLVVVPPTVSSQLEVVRITPSEPLGPLHHGLVWSPDRIRHWMELGECDGNLAVSRL